MESTNKNPHAVALGRLGGSKKTKAKEEAARLNGKKGGRPRKTAQDLEDEATEKMTKRLTNKSKAARLSRSILG